jgi:small-conductance mechanosensitive channel
VRNETVSIILLLIALAGGLAWLLHWLIGVVQRRLVRRFVSAEPTEHEQSSLGKLFIEWSGHALRTVNWALLAFFVIHLLPQTRARFETFSAGLYLLRDQASDWLMTAGVNLAIDVIATIFLARFAAALIRTGFNLFEKRAIGRGETTARRRSQTLSSIFRGVAQSLIFFLGLMAVLQHLNVNVTPILASAGVLGVAVGFGAQSLIKDFFAGFMILLEDQYNVGDVIKIGETAGVVERLTLRMTSVRALDGALITIPNGTITTVSNLSKDWARAVLDMEIDYTEDADRAMEVMLATARQLREEHPAEIIEEPGRPGMERLTQNSIGLRLTIKTAANKQADIGRELRRRTKLAFDQLGIKGPSREQFVLKGKQRGEMAAAPEGQETEPSLAPLEQPSKVQ